MIQKLIQQLRERGDCIVLPPVGLPVLKGEEHQLPQDLIEFYQVCGGMELFTEADFCMTIVRPEDFVLAYITIDLWNNRLGRCYDSFFDRHGSIGNCDIVAKSFTELISHLIDNGGKSLYFTEDDFEYLGDAYDE